MAELRALADDLFREHYEEVARHKRIMQLSPDWDRYETIEANGSLFALAAWVGGTLVGYSATFIGAHLHYSGLIFAQNDVLFVAPDYRGGAGKMLIRATEDEARARGAQMLTWHAKQGTALDRILPHLRYDVHDVIYSKEL